MDSWFFENSHSSEFVKFSQKYLFSRNLIIFQLGVIKAFRSHLEDIEEFHDSTTYYDASDSSDIELTKINVST